MSNVTTLPQFEIRRGENAFTALDINEKLQTVKGLRSPIAEVEITKEVLGYLAENDFDVIEERGRTTIIDNKSEEHSFYRSWGFNGISNEPDRPMVMVLSYEFLIQEKGVLIALTAKQKFNSGPTVHTSRQSQLRMFNSLVRAEFINLELPFLVIEMLLSSGRLHKPGTLLIEWNEIGFSRLAPLSDVRKDFLRNKPGLAKLANSSISPFNPPLTFTYDEVDSYLLNRAGRRGIRAAWTAQIEEFKAGL